MFKTETADKRRMKTQNYSWSVVFKSWKQRKARKKGKITIWTYLRARFLIIWEPNTQMMEPTVVTYRLVSPKGTELLEILKELIFVGFVRDQENCPYI